MFFCLSVPEEQSPWLGRHCNREGSHSSRNRKLAGHIAFPLRKLRGNKKWVQATKPQIPSH